MNSVLLMLVASAAFSQGGKRPEPPKNLKRVVTINPIPDRYIEMPGVEMQTDDRLIYAYGRNISQRVISTFVSEDRFVVLDPSVTTSASRVALDAGPADPDPVHLGEIPVPTAEVTGRVTELWFQTGERAERAMYGFRPGYENPYNASNSSVPKNEFTPALLPPDDRSGFGKTFEDTGDLHVGKEIGSELNFDVFFLGAALKHSRYFARMGLELRIRDGVTLEEKTRHVNITSEGIYFELAGTYLGFTVGITASRRAAMNQAFQSTTGVLASTLMHELLNRKFVTNLVVTGRDSYFIPAGKLNYRMKEGQRFYSRSSWELGEQPAIFQVEKVYRTVAKLKLMSRYGVWRSGDRLVSLLPDEPPPSRQSHGMIASASSALSAPELQNLSTPPQNFNPIEILGAFIENAITRFFKGVEALLTFPFRVARFFQYDQDFGGGEFFRVDLAKATSLARQNWALTRLGAEQVWKSSMGNVGTVVAVLDTGIDYNHGELRRSIFFDGPSNSAGYDFYADDNKPYDDHAHGTAVASAIAGGGGRLVGVAPHATLMPVKVFSSYGVTSSAALYQGFQYAIEKGAKIIVVGWATPVRSEALRDGIRLARDNGVLVVAAAGDTGDDLSRRPLYPASFAEAFDNVVVVAGLDRNGALFQNQGPLGLSSAFGGPTHIAAPASDVLVASPRGGYTNAHYSGVAAGFAGGAAALAWAMCPGLNADGVKSVLLRSVVPRQGGINELQLQGLTAESVSHCNQLPTLLN